jgi:hypothetical protein
MHKFYKDIKGEISSELFQPLSYSPSDALNDFTFYEFTLKELGLPESSILLDQVKVIEQQVGLQNWVNQTKAAKSYKGFSLTYNPDYLDNIDSIYHQTWGSNQLTQNFSRQNQTDINIKNTYYDTYAFRKLPPLVKEHLGDFISKFNFSIFRSRIAYFNPIFPKIQDESWHKDEPPFQLLRINIPLQTCQEHVIDIDGTDDYGNSFTLLNKHLEIGKAYIWNTRIPHRIYINKMVSSFKPRIHIVLGLSPWINYNDEDDSYSHSDHYGKSIKDIVVNKFFLK